MHSVRMEHRFVKRKDSDTACVIGHDCKETAVRLRTARLCCGTHCLRSTMMQMRRCRAMNVTAETWPNCCPVNGQRRTAGRNPEFRSERACSGIKSRSDNLHQLVTTCTKLETRLRDLQYVVHRVLTKGPWSRSALRATVSNTLGTLFWKCDLRQIH